MTSEEYVILNPRETEVPSSISFIQNHYENLKKRLTLVGVSISLCSFLLLHVGQLVTSITLLQNCVVDKYTPAYFIVAGVTGIIPKVYHFVTANENNNLESKKCIPILMLYVFELAWLITGTYYYVFQTHHNGCSKAAYVAANWLILFHYACLILCSIIFTWSLSIIFMLVYFKNKIVQNLAKQINL